MSEASNKQTPSHVAIIMDGNGRWANAQNRPRVYGHETGRSSVNKVVTASAEAGVKVLSLFAFSTENWRRPKAEVNLLMHLMQRTLDEEIDKMFAEGIRFRVIGDRNGLSANLNKKIARAEELTRDCALMQVILAINYSGRWAMIETAKNIANAVTSGEIGVDDININTFEQARPMPDLPPVDLLIRTSGEMRISNFHLWELAYAELYFTETLWPDFGADDLRKALEVYDKRERRFGALN